MRKTKVWMMASAVVLLCGNGSPATAHDLKGLVVERASLDPAVKARFDEIQEVRSILAARAAAPGASDGQLEAVVQKALRWGNGRASVCFFDGMPAARDHVAKVTNQWTESTGLSFDFGPAGNRRTCNPAAPSDVRVSFRGEGYWSYVGTQAKFIDANKQTLNLSGLDKSNFSSSDDGVILHEFGHAIGFEHEHQSPAANCDDEFDWQYLYTTMGWSKEEVDRNMRKIATTPSTKTDLLTTPFDNKSIMLYALSPQAFKSPATAKCFIMKPNDTISTVDHQATQTVYPQAGGAAPPLPPAAPPPAAAPGPGQEATARAVQRLKTLVETPAK